VQFKDDDDDEDLPPFQAECSLSHWQSDAGSALGANSKGLAFLYKGRVAKKRKKQKLIIKS
jgi:hypothetical protein